MDIMQRRTSAPLYLRFACIVMIPILVFGCSHFYEGSLVGSTFKEANDLLSRGSYEASLNKYEQLLERNPTAADRVLFEMGIIYAYPSNEQKDYQKSLECFERILKDYPASRYRQDSAEMISHIENAIIKDRKITTQLSQIGALEQELRNRESEVFALQKRIEALEQDVRNRESEVIALQTQTATLAEGIKNKENETIALQKRIEALEQELRSAVSTLQKGQVSKILIEKGERKLTLISKDKVLKSYKIALGGNPNGPKERKGDGKTPEGTYTIDSRNKDSRYHLSLHISYPNERDKKRAKELGVSPGGNIMIHGLKNGFSWVGDSHTELDWTEGCVAVTDEEIEEIADLVPNGTIVEIRP
jgi:tetratricopeptide (TPR) repeat protein